MKFMNSNYSYADFAGGRNRSGRNTKQVVSQVDDAFDIPVGKPSTKAKYPAPSSTIPMKPPSAESLKTLENDMKRGESRSSTPPASKRIRAREGANSSKLFRRGRVALKQAGRFAMRNKVGTGLAAAGALGAVGLGIAGVRKMRADKGKKRGSYSR
jgi:hypothetical protein